MQRKLIIIASLLISSFYSGVVHAQQTTKLAPDQNPRYLESEYKYVRNADTLNSLHGTTIQNTYKAYDWYEAKLERRQQNREWRHQERLNGYDYSPSWGLYSGYSYPYSSFGYGWGGGYGNRWGGWGGGRWGGRASIGIGYGW